MPLTSTELYSVKDKGGVMEVCQKLLPEHGAVNFLIYTPDFCGFAERQGEGFKALAGKDIPLADIFELRAFCEDFELRWVRDGDSGSGVLLSDSQKPMGDKLGGEFFKSSGQYLLWGTGKDGGLFDYRIGKLPVPLSPLQKDQQVCLTFDEYFQADRYGNMTWHSERLKGLKAL